MMSLRQRTAEVLEPDFTKDRVSRVVNVSLIVLISLNVLAITLESIDEIYARYQPAFRAFEVFSVAVFTIEYVVRVWCSIDREGAKDRSPILGRIRYMLTPLALVDLIAILPFYLSFYVKIDLRFLRGLRLLRLFKLSRYSPALSALLDVIRKESAALLAAIFVLLILLMISAGGIYVLENEIQPETFGSIPSAMWWAIVTLTTLGYGDVVPVTTGGKIFGGLIGLLGIGMIALPAAIMASGFADNIHARQRRYSRYAQRYLEDGELDERERRHLEEIRKELGLDSDEALQQLRAIQEEIARESQPTTCPHCGKDVSQASAETSVGAAHGREPR